MVKKTKQDNYLVKDPWYYAEKGERGKEVETPPEGAIGFIYCIEKTWWDASNIYHNKIYIGKKQVISSLRKRIGIKEKMETKTRKTYKQITKESDWKTYWGSCRQLLEDKKVNDHSIYSRIILEWCYTKRYMTFCELKHQLLKKVLEKDSYNDNISGKYFRGIIEENEEVKNGYTGTNKTV